MKAVLRRNYGTPDQVEIAELDMPQPSAGQLRVRVHAAGIDRGTLHLLTGTPTLMRLATGLRVPKQPVLGLDFAGTIDALGPGVTGWAVGDEVFGPADGALAEYCLASVDRLARKPQRLDFAQASALAVSGLTALQALRDQAKVQSGERVLVIGASGGVGHYAVQLAVAMGCAVTGVCSAAKAAAVRELGAAEVLDRALPLPADGRFDAIIDIGGMRPLAELRAALTPTGRLVLVGGEGGGRLLGGLGRQIRGMLASIFGPRKVTFFASAERADDVQELADYAERGAITPRIDTAYPISDATAALRQVAEGRVTGKVVVQLTESS